MRSALAFNRNAAPAIATPTASHPTTLLPLGALLLAGSLNAWAQQPAAQTPASESTLGTVTVREQAEPDEIKSKDTLRVSTTTLGKGRQQLRDIPQSITVMTEHLLDDRNLDNFRDVLKATAGITFLAGETGEEDVRLRGFSLGQAGDVYRNGMREGQLITRDTFATDRVEVLKGSASMLFGKGSTGGVVNQVGKQPFLMDRYEMEVNLGSGQHKRVQADLNKQLSQDSAVRVNAMIQNADFWGARDDRTGIAAGWRTGIGERDEFSVDFHHLRTRERPNYNHPWLLLGTATDQQRKILPQLAAQNYYGLASDYQNTDQNSLSLRHKHRFGAQEELQTSVQQGIYKRDLWVSAIGFCNGTLQSGATNPVCPGQSVSVAAPPQAATILNRQPKGRYGQSKITQLQSNYTNKFKGAGVDHDLIAGVDLTMEHAKRNNSFAGPASGLWTLVSTPNDGAQRPDLRGEPPLNRFEANSLGLYLQNVASLTSTLKLVGGLRLDHFKATYLDAEGNRGSIQENLWSPRVGAIFQPDDASSYYVSFGQSYNTSGDAYQFSNNNSFAPTLVQQGKVVRNPNHLQGNTPPEKSRNLEVGAKWELLDNKASVNVALFHSEKYNERNTDPDSAAQQMLLSGKRHATGVELGAAGRLTPQWEVFYNHTWIPSASIDKSNVTGTGTGGAQREGDRPALTPRHSLSAWTTYRVTPHWRLGLGMTYRGEQNPEGNRNTVADAFTVWDGMAEYTVNDNTTVKINVSNLSNLLYADSLYRGFYGPGAPRKVTLSLKTVF